MGNYDNYKLIRLINLKKIQILIITGTAVLLAIFFSSPIFIAPKFKSVGVIYPSNLSAYGIESPTEQLLQLLNSEDLRDQIIEMYHLADHYSFDSVDRHFKSMLIQEFNSNVEISKTEFESVKIEVYDTDPVLSSKIAYSLIELMNQKARTLQREKSNEVVAVRKKIFLEKKSEIDSMETRLKELRVKFGLLDYKIQTEYATRSYLKLLGGNSSQQAQSKQLLPIIRNLEEKGGEFVSLNEYLYGERIRYNQLKFEYEHSLSDVTKELTYANMVTSPAVPDKKAYPIRWAIILTAAISGFAFSILTIIFQDKKKSLMEAINATG